MATVRAENLYKVFGRKREAAIQRLREGATREDLLTEGVTAGVIDASFEAKEGETFVVMGLSGSGKSTLIRMLNGILPASAGSVYIDDADVTKLNPNALRALRSEKMSMVFQHFALFPHRTVVDNAAYGLEVRGEKKATRREKAGEALEMVGLEGWNDSYPAQLSGGMKQRVGLARALATDTEVMLMDEAFSALDPLIRRDMQDQLIELQRRLHKTVVFITHDLNEAMKLGDRIAMLRAGRIEQIGTAQEILNEPASEYVATFVQDVDRSRVLTASDVMVEPKATVRTQDTLTDANAALHGTGFQGLHVLDVNGRLVGALTTTHLSEAARSGNGKSCGELAAGNVPTAKPADTVVNLFGSAAGSTVPIAVIDDDHHLLGVISQATLLSALDSDNASALAAGSAPLTGGET